MKQLFHKGALSPYSPVFSVKKQVTVFAFGLEAGDYIEFELVYVPTASGDPCECVPFQAELPQVGATAPLMCCSGRIRLTNTTPFVIIDAPQSVGIRAVLTAADPTAVVAWLEETDTPNVTDRLRGCPCEE